MGPTTFCCAMPRERDIDLGDESQVDITTIQEGGYVDAMDKNAAQGVAAKMFETLATANINIEMISTSAIRLTCVVREDEAERAVGVLHEAFELHKG